MIYKKKFVTINGVMFDPEEVIPPVGQEVKFDINVKGRTISLVFNVTYRNVGKLRFTADLSKGKSDEKSSSILSFSR